MRLKIDEAALATLHPDAHAHVLAGRSGTLEARARQPHSSQALCVDFFGSIEQRPAVRDRVASALLKRAGLSVLGAHGPVEIRTEIRRRRQLLNE